MITCKHSTYIEGSAQPGTYPSVSDLANIVGGAEYLECGKPAEWLWTSNKTPLCSEHFSQRLVMFPREVFSYAL